MMALLSPPAILAIVLTVLLTLPRYFPECSLCQLLSLKTNKHTTKHMNQRKKKKRGGAEQEKKTQQHNLSIKS